MSSGVYRHVRSGRLYNLVGIARDVVNPTKKVMVYSQLYSGVLSGGSGGSDTATETPLPIGSMWIRDEQDFYDKFEKIQ